jgi:serine/threonine-protein kinase
VDPLIGTVVGDRYRIVERIGEGGMAVVYRGEHQLLKKRVAIKVLLPEIAVDVEMAARFEHEAIAAARLDHPNCIGITDFGQIAGSKGAPPRLYLVMELIDGVPLSEACGNGRRLPWQRAIEIARQVLRGLARAHELGIVHRDLKPSNVMLIARPGGWEIAKIIDFGIAKIVGESPLGPRVETKAGTVFGTADFIAPERLVGQPGDDPRSDLYAVGVLLYEMCTGSRPFHAEEALTIVRRAMTEEPEPPSKRCPEANLPRRLEATILHALRKDPAERQQTARELLGALDADELRTAANPVVAAAVGAEQEHDAARAAERKKRLVWWGSGAGAAVLVVLALVLSSAGGDSGTRLAKNGGAAGRSGAEGDALAAPVAAEVARLVKQAATDDSMALRQSAADRLVALGFVDKVPLAHKLARDLQQAPNCSARLAVLAQLEKLKDVETLTSARVARARPDNHCLHERAHKLVEALEAKAKALAEAQAAQAQSTQMQTGSDKAQTGSDKAQTGSDKAQDQGRDNAAPTPDAGAATKARPTPPRQSTPAKGADKKPGGGGHF